MTQAYSGRIRLPALLFMAAALALPAAIAQVVVAPDFGRYERPFDESRAASASSAVKT